MIFLTDPTTIRIPKSDLTDLQVQQVKARLSYVDKKVQYDLTRLKNRARWMDEEDFEREQKELKSKLNVCLFFEDVDSFWSYSGLCDVVGEILKCEVHNGITYPEPQLLPWVVEPPTMRPYQKEMVQKLLQCRHGGVSVGTGLGKSIALINLVKQLGLKTMVMAPSGSIAEQLYGDFVKFFGKRYVGRAFGGKKEYKKLIVVATGQTLTRIEEGTEGWEECSKISVFIADEAHVVPATTFQYVCLGPLKNAQYRFFFTATMMRNDGSDTLLRGITGPTVFEMTVREGVNTGFLAKPIFHVYDAPSNGDFISDDPARMTRHHLYHNPVIMRHAGNLANMAVKSGLPVLILIDEVDTFTKILPYLKYEVGFAHGTLSDNKSKVPQQYWDSDPNDLVDKFNKGEFKILVGTSCISTGTDVRAVKFLIYLKGGKSEIEVKQGVGRGTRLVPGKTSCHVVDYWVNSPDGTRYGSKEARWGLGYHTKVRCAIYDDLYGPVHYEGKI